MSYESFNNSKQKIKKIWEKNEQNESNIDNKLQKFDLDFSSVNFLKNITTIPIQVLSPNEEDNSIFTSSILNQLVTINLINIPEWIINHINIIPIVEVVGDVNDDIIHRTLNNIAQAGQLEIGDLQFITNVKHWIAKLDENNYILKMILNINVRIVTTINQPVQGNFSTEALPFTIDLNLKIFNPRIYEKTNVHKQ